MLPFKQELTLRSVTDVDQFPLLDSFHWEILRMFPAPPFYVKVSVTEAFFQKEGLLYDSDIMSFLWVSLVERWRGHDMV